jgi:hypothetical protein
MSKFDELIEKAAIQEDQKMYLLLTVARIMRARLQEEQRKNHLAAYISEDLKDLAEALKPFDAKDEPPINEASNVR